MYTCYIQSFKILASAAEQPGLNVTWSKIPEDTFSRDVAHMMSLLLSVTMSCQIPLQSFLHCLFQSHNGTEIKSALLAHTGHGIPIHFITYYHKKILKNLHIQKIAVIILKFQQDSFTV